MANGVYLSDRHARVAVAAGGPLACVLSFDRRSIRAGRGVFVVLVSIRERGAVAGLRGDCGRECGFVCDGRDYFLTADSHGLITD